MRRHIENGELSLEGRSLIYISDYLVEFSTAHPKAKNLEVITYLEDSKEEVYWSIPKELQSMPFLAKLDLQPSGDYAKFHLDGRSIYKLVQCAPNLEELYLEGVNYAQDALNSLQKLSKLKFLSITLGPEQCSFQRLDIFIRQKLIISNSHTINNKIRWYHNGKDVTPNKAGKNYYF
jgi:hypothetical protein